MPYEVRTLDQLCYIGSVYPPAAGAALASVKPADQPFRLSILLDEEDGLEPQSQQDGLAIPHQLETRQVIDLFRRTSSAATSIRIDDPTFA